jgi:hypothetical protein
MRFFAAALSSAQFTVNSDAFFGDFEDAFQTLRSPA